MLVSVAGVCVFFGFIFPTLAANLSELAAWKARGRNLPNSEEEYDYESGLTWTSDDSVFETDDDERVADDGCFGFTVFDEEEENCGFNYTRAVRLGFEFQKEFCQKNSVKGVSSFDGRLHECPSCVGYSSDDTNGDDWSNYFRFDDSSFSGHRNVSEDVIKIRRLDFKPSQYVTIIVSCPLNSTHSDNPNFPEDSVKFHENSENQSTARSKDNPLSRRSLCDSCLEDSDSLALVTSRVSGRTYCNGHCLTCLEGPLPPSDVLAWTRVKKCQMVSPVKSRRYPNTVHVVSSCAVDNGTLEEVCWLEFDPPPEVVPRTFFGEEIVKAYEPGDFGFPEDADPEVLEKMELLCLSYYWPVYTEDFLFRNLFCYLRRHTILEPPMFPPPTPHHEWPNLDIRTLDTSISILTDLSGHRYHRADQLTAGHLNLVFDYDPDGDDDDDDDDDNDDGDSTSKSFFGTTCKDVLWFNFLTGKCTPLRCSYGLKLTKSSESSIGLNPTTSSESSNGPNPTTSSESSNGLHPTTSSESSNGLDPTTSSESNIPDWQCVPASSDQNDTAHGGSNNSFYVLKLLWYETSRNGSDAHPYNIPKSVELDSVLEVAATRDGGSAVLTNASTFSCDSDMAKPKWLVYTRNISSVGDKGVSDRLGVEFALSDIDGNDSPIGDNLHGFNDDDDENDEDDDDDDDDDDDADVDDDNDDGVLNYLQTGDILDVLIINQTDRILRSLNISSYLMSLSLSPPNKSVEDSHSRFLLARPRQMVVYFNKSSSGDDRNQHQFKKEILRTFSKTVNITYDGEDHEFRSILLRKHSQENWSHPRTAIYFLSTGGNDVNGSTLRDEINVREFSRTLTSIACGGGTATPDRIHFLSTCPQVTFNSSDFNITSEDTLVHRETGLLLQRHQYLLFSRSKVHVCYSTLESLKKFFTSNTTNPSHAHPLLWWEGRLTLVLLPVSMLCLLVTFVTYCSFPILRSMPGKNNMCLVFWLFCAQALVLLSPRAPRHSPLCVAMGIALHYSWLATLAWTCVCSFHMFHVFVLCKGTPGIGRSHACYLLCYASVAHLAPLLVVAVVCLASGHVTPDASPGYGGGVCYLNSPLLVGLAFLLPLSLVLVLNMVFFFSTVVVISHIRKIKRQTGSERRNTNIYFRLSSMTSVTWLLAVMAELPGCGFLRLVSVVVNSCQGVFLFFSYIVNKRVHKLWTMGKRDTKRGGMSTTSAASGRLVTTTTTTTTNFTTTTASTKTARSNV